jgi:hypothetical protein
MLLTLDGSGRVAIDADGDAESPPGIACQHWTESFVRGSGKAQTVREGVFSGSYPAGLRAAVGDGLELVHDVGLFDQFFRHGLTSDAQAICVEAFGAVDNDAIEEEVGELLLGKDAGHARSLQLSASAKGSGAEAIILPPMREKQKQELLMGDIDSAAYRCRCFFAAQWRWDDLIPEEDDVSVVLHESVDLC